MCASGYNSSAAEASTAPANVSSTQRKTVSQKWQAYNSVFYHPA